MTIDSAQAVAFTITLLMAILSWETVIHLMDELRVLIAKHDNRVLDINRTHALHIEGLRRTHALQIEGLHIQYAAEIQDIETRHAADLICKIKFFGEKFAAEKIEQAEKLAASVQDRFAKMLRDSYSSFGSRIDDLRGIIHKVKDLRPRMVACISEPMIDFDRDSIRSMRSTQTRQIDMVRFSIGVGMSEEVPPELIVEQIVDELRVAILRKWQSQSLLLA